MQSTCTEATRSDMLSTSLCQRRSKSWGTRKMQDTKSPSWPRARSSRLRSGLLTSREICAALGKEEGRDSEPPQAQSGKVWGSQSHFTGGRTEAQKDRRAGRATEPSTLKEGDRSAGHRVGARDGARDGTEGSPNSQAGTEVGLDGYC